MDILRTSIETALNELMANQEGFRFQSLAVVLARLKWPELIAHEWQKDLGLDAYAPASVAKDGIGRGLACSISEDILDKIKGDADTAKKKYPDLRVLIFATPRKVTQQTAQTWAEEIRAAFDLELIVMPREEIITSLLMPANAGVCRSALRIPLPVEQSKARLLAKVTEASAEVARNWRARTRTSDRPTISLSGAKLDDTGTETDDRFDEKAMREALWQSRRISLEAPGGRGKTTTLTRLATEDQRDGEVFLLVDLPVWIQSGDDVLEFVAREPAFRSRNISAAELASLRGSLHFSFLLNGWNEIAEAYSQEAITAVGQLDRAFPDAGVIIATRTHYISPPLPGCTRIGLLSLNRKQRADYLKQVLAERSDELRIRIESSRVLDSLTRTPLLLTQIVTLFQSGEPLPDTRVGVLDAATRLMETSAEHRPHLQLPPVSNRAALYLTRLASQMTQCGEVVVEQTAANQVIQAVTADLLAKGQLAVAPNPDAILQVLCAHHVLERIENPSIAFRFQHQQFQEFYASRFLLDVLNALPATSEHAFAGSYIDKPMWEEALIMVAEDIQRFVAGATSRMQAISLGMRLVGMASTVNPIFAGDLACHCGPELWPHVRSDLGKILRRWYAVNDSHHRQLALSGMFSTGSDDFLDIIGPLLSDDNRQVRLSAYHTAASFHLTTLGKDWRQTVNTWSEGARADFAYQVSHYGRMADIVEDLALNDPSMNVRQRAIQGISWIGATDALGRVVTALDDATLEALLPVIFHEVLPPELHSRIAEANRRSIRPDTPPLDRLRRLLHAQDFDDAISIEDLKAALDMLSPPFDQYADHALQEALDVAQKLDPNWTAAWVSTKLLDETIWGKQWQRYLGLMPNERQQSMVLELSTAELSYRRLCSYRSILSASETPAIAQQVFLKMCELRQTATNNSGSLPLAWKCLEQLKDMLRAMPVKTAMAGIVESLPDQFDQNVFGTIVDFLGRVNPDAEEMRSAIPDPQLQRLRWYIKNGIAKALVDDHLSPDARSYAAVALGRIGAPDDVEQVRQLIKADIQRQNAETGPRTVYANKYIQALLWLDAAGADALLLALLDELHYEDEASRALLRLAVQVDRQSPWSGNTTAFEEIWSRRGREARPGVDEARARRYADAIRTRIAQIRQQAGTSLAENQIGRMKGLAIVLAVLDGKHSAEVVIEIMQLPGRWDSHGRMAAVRALLMSGANLSVASIQAVLDPAIENLFSNGINNELNVSILFDCLELLPFGDDPARGIARIGEVLQRLKYRPYQVRELVHALGYTRSDAATPLLIDLASADKALDDNMKDAWVKALGRLATPSARQALLAFVDPELPNSGVSFDPRFHVFESLVAFIGTWAREDTALRERLLRLGGAKLDSARRRLLAGIYSEIGTDECLMAMTDLLEHSLSFGRERGFEALFLERRNHGSPGSYSLIPRNAESARAKLFKIIIDDPTRSRAASSVLGRIEVSRIEYGRPASEPRHPMIESNKPWPPLDSMNWS